MAHYDLNKIDKPKTPLIRSYAFRESDGAAPEFVRGSPSRIAIEANQLTNLITMDSPRTPVIPDSNLNMESSFEPTIIMVLDASGSMSEIIDSMRDSVNLFIKNQQGDIDSAHVDNSYTSLSMYIFSTSVDRIRYNEPVDAITPVTPYEYKAAGTTALYDAIGTAIDDHEHKKNVIMVIVTDGEENYSCNYDRSTITKMIELKKITGWQFIYLSSGLEVSSQGSQLGFTTGHSNSANCNTSMNMLSSVIEREISDSVRAYCSTSHMSQLPDLI